MRRILHNGLDLFDGGGLCEADGLDERSLDHRVHGSFEHLRRLTRVLEIQIVRWRFFQLEVHFQQQVLLEHEALNQTPLEVASLVQVPILEVVLNVALEQVLFHSVCGKSECPHR